MKINETIRTFYNEVDDEAFGWVAEAMSDCMYGETEEERNRGREYLQYLIKDENFSVDEFCQTIEALLDEQCFG